jgi:dTMP kinase
MQRAAARRGTGTPDRFEAEDLEFHQELREGYKQIAVAEPQRCVLIDATADPATVAANIWTTLRDRLFAASANNAVTSA